MLYWFSIKVWEDDIFVTTFVLPEIVFQLSGLTDWPNKKRVSAVHVPKETYCYGWIFLTASSQNLNNWTKFWPLLYCGTIKENSLCNKALSSRSWAFQTSLLHKYIDIVTCWILKTTVMILRNNNIHKWINKMALMFISPLCKNGRNQSLVLVHIWRRLVLENGYYGDRVWTAFHWHLILIFVKT